jgi:hypothetical protein
MFDNLIKHVDIFGGGVERDLDLDQGAAHDRWNGPNLGQNVLESVMKLYRQFPIFFIT